MSELKELIILGQGPTRVDCTYHCETWGVNGGYGFAPRLDKLFMTDSLEGEVLEEEYRVDKLLEFKGTLVLPKPFPVFDGLNIPVEIYPIDEVLAKFKTRFFSNTIAYMLAYALLHTEIVVDNPIGLPRVVSGYNKIWFYGIDMMTNTSYVQEKGGVEFWMGVALAMGVEIINTRGSATGKTWNGKMYGYWGLQEEEELKEQLLAPWEIIRTQSIQDEWTKVGEDWIKVPYGTGVK